MAKQFQCRPSSLLAIEDPYVAWCFDEAAYRWGSHVETQLRAVKGKTEAQIEGKQRILLKRLMEGKSPYREPPSEVSSNG